MKPVLVLFLASQVFAQTPLTPAQTLRIRNLSGLRFSPDGQRLALDVREPVKATTANSHVWVLNVRTGDLRQWTSSAKTENNAQWSPDGRYLAFLSNRDENRQLYLMRSDGGEAERLTEAKNSIQNFQWSPDSKQIAFSAGEPKTADQEKREKDKADQHVVDRDDKPARLWVVDVESRKVRQLTKSPWRVQDFAWVPGQAEFVVKATDKPAADQWLDRIYTVALAGGKMTEIAAPRGPFARLRVSLDGKQLAYAGSPGDGPTSHDLFVMPLTGGVAKNWTAARLDRPVHQFEWRPDGSFVALVQRGFAQEVESIRSSGLERMFTDFKLHPSDIAISDRGAIGMVAADATTMPELWLAAAGSAPRQMSHFNEEWTKIPLRPSEIVKYPSFDGTMIETQLFKPAGYHTGAKLPTVVLVHGGPTGAFSERFYSWAQLLATRGYLVMCPNIRGSTGYGEKFIEINRTDWGGGDFKDVMAGVDWLISRGDADPDRLGIGGWSYGGYMAMWAVTQTNRFRASVAGAGMSDLASEFGTEGSSTGDEWFYGTPWEHLSDFQKSSPITFVKNAKTPTLILQGEADRTDPIGQSQQFYRALKRYGVKSDFVTYPREGHGIAEEKHQLDLLERMVAWFDTYLK
ncbi:MAG TPA: S9 family peptidase [Bryobacteraceae bacterium]|nr:S9 family peptidase [Bryobacteraceae bacterium]